LLEQLYQEVGVMWEKMGIENAIKMFFEHLKGRE
jgi:hypothetical protein